MEEYLWGYKFKSRQTHLGGPISVLLNHTGVFVHKRNWLDENNGVDESKSRAGLGDGRGLLQRARFSVGWLNGFVLVKLGCSQVFMNKKSLGSFQKNTSA